MIVTLEKNRKIKDSIIYLKLFQLFKSYLFLISDQKEMGIGDVSLCSPSTIEGINPRSSSFHLFGTDKKLLSSIISERTANKLKKPVLLLLFIKKQYKEEEILKPLMEFINETLDSLDLD